MTNKAAIGIDVGVSGGIAIRCAQGTIVAPMEACNGGLDGAWLGNWIRQNIQQHELSPVIFVEQVWAFPGQGVTSVFSFGHCLGMIEGVIKTLGLKYELVPPMRWKKEFDLIKKKDESLSPAQQYKARKDLSIQRAKEIFPNLNLIPTVRARSPHTGMADALLLAEYGWRLLNRPKLL